MVLLVLESGILLSSEERRWQGKPWTMVGERHGLSNSVSFIPKPLLRVFQAPCRCSISEALCLQRSGENRKSLT